MTQALHLAYLQAPPAPVAVGKGALGKVMQWIAAAFGPLFVVEPKLLALFILLSITDIITAGFFAEGKVIKAGRGKAARGAVYRFLQNLVGAGVLVFISNGFAFFTFLGPWVIAYVCLRVARHVINAVTPAESDLRALWERFWKVFYDRNAEVIETTAGDSMRSEFRRAQGLRDSSASGDGSASYIHDAPGSSEGQPAVEGGAPEQPDPYGDLM